MSARKIRGHWYVDLRHDGRRCRKRSPDDSRAGAVAYEATLRGRLARGESLVPPPQLPPPPRFEVFAWRWYHTYVETNNKPSEQKSKRLNLRNHLIPWFGKRPLDAITPLALEEFKAAKLKTELSPKSINNILAVLGKCLRTAEEWGELDRLPKLRPLKVPPQKFDFLSLEEADRLIGNAHDPQWRAMVTVALRTGLRLGELLGLDWSDVDFEVKLLTVRRSVYLNRFVAPKSNRIRHIPLTNEAASALDALHRSSGGLVFARRGPGPLNHKTPQRVIADLCQQAGIRPVGWHILRHTFASHLAMGGVSIKAIQELLGHSDVRTTMRYAHLAPSVLREAVRVLEPTRSLNLDGHQMGSSDPTSLARQQKNPD